MVTYKFKKWQCSTLYKQHNNIRINSLSGQKDILQLATINLFILHQMWSNFLHLILIPLADSFLGLNQYSCQKCRMQKVTAGSLPCQNSHQWSPEEKVGTLTLWPLLFFSISHFSKNKIFKLWTLEKKIIHTNGKNQQVKL